MGKHVPIESWLRRGLMLLAGVALMAGCRGAFQAMPGAVLPAASEPGAGSAYAGPMGTATIRVGLPEKFASDDRKRYSVQFVDFNQSANLKLYYAGVGLDGWVPAPTSGWSSYNATFQTVGNFRVAAFDNVPVPAGLRRLIRADLIDNQGRTMTSQWGVGDVAVLPPGAPATTPASIIEVTPYTTPTAEIFRNLLTTGDAAKALALPVADVQAMIDRMLDMDTSASPDVAFDGNLDGGVVPIPPALLNTYPATVAIANGARDASGVYVPYTVPTPVPAPHTAAAGWPLDLYPTPVRQATVVLKVIDSDGSPVNKPCLTYVTDLVSPIQTYNGTGSPADSVTFFPVAIGDYRAVVTDTTTGRTASVPIYGLKDKETRTVTVALPFSGIQKALGAYNLKNEAGFGYNGAPVHHSIAYMNKPRQLAIRNGVLYFVDEVNDRIRGVKLDSAAGANYGLPEPDAMVFDVVGVALMSAESDLAFDKTGALLFCDRTAGAPFDVRVRRQALKPDGTPLGAPTTLVNTRNVLGFPIETLIGGIAFDDNGAAGTLYIAQKGGGAICEIDLGVYTLTEPNPTLTGTRVITTSAASSSIAQRRVLTDPNQAPDYYSGAGAGDPVASRVYNTEANYLFYARQEDLSYLAGDPPVAQTKTIHSLVRRSLPRYSGFNDTETETVIVGNVDLFLELNYGPTEALDYQYTLPAPRFYPEVTYQDLTLDAVGNLYFLTQAPSYGAKDFKSYNNVMRVTDVLAGSAADAEPRWWLSMLDVRGKQGLPKAHSSIDDLDLPEHVYGLGINPDRLAGATVPDLYVSGLAAVSSPNGHIRDHWNNEVRGQRNTRYAHAIHRVRL